MAQQDASDHDRKVDRSYGFTQVAEKSQVLYVLVSTPEWIKEFELTFSLLRMALSGTMLSDG
eukprot:549612-Pyramimonas_sp.AAC.1